MMCIYKHCFPPMLLILTMKCCTNMPCPLPHNHYCCLLFSSIYACLACSSVHASSLHPLLSQHHLCYVDVYCVFLFLMYATFLCESILDCLCTYFCLIVFFYTISFWLCIIVYFDYNFLAATELL